MLASSKFEKKVIAATTYSLFMLCVGITYCCVMMKYVVPVRIHLKHPSVGEAFVPRGRREKKKPAQWGVGITP